MEANLLCWCDEAGTPQGAPALQYRLIQSAEIIRDLVSKLAYLERHAEKVHSEDGDDLLSVHLSADDWQHAMAPIYPRVSMNNLLADYLIIMRQVAEQSFQAALQWQRAHPEATAAAASEAGKAYAAAILHD